MPKYKTYNDVPVKKYKTYDDVKVKTHWEEDASQPLDADTIANNPITPALARVKKDGNSAAAKQLLDTAPYNAESRVQADAYTDAVLTAEKRAADAKNAAVQATIQPMGYGGLSKALRDRELPKKEMSKTKETLREGNPAYNDDYAPGVDYPKFRTQEDIDYEIASAEKHRAENLPTRYPEAAELTRKAIAGDTAASEQLQALAAKYAEENAVYDQRIAELKKEKKDSKNKAVLQRRERAATAAENNANARYDSAAFADLNAKISATESDTQKRTSEYDMQLEKLCAERDSVAKQRDALYSGAQNHSMDAETEYRFYATNQRGYELHLKVKQLDKQIADMEKKRAQAINAGESEIYRLRGTQTLAELPEEDRAAVLNGVLAMRGNSAAGMNTSIPQTFDFSTGKYRILTEDEFKQIRADYSAVIRKLKASGVSDADIRRMETTLNQSADAMIAAGGNVQTAAFALQYPTLSSAISVVSNLASGVTVGGAEIGRVVGNAFRGEGYKAPMNINGAAYAPVRATNDIRGTIAERIEEGNGTAGKVGSFAYQTLMSTADSVVSSVLGNVGGAAAIGGSAYASAIVDAKEKGETDAQALSTGIAAGIFETLFERVSIGNFNALKEVPPATLRDVAKNVVKSTVVNASEEAATEIANIIADAIIGGNLSGYAEAYNGYLADGSTPSEAKRLALLDMAKQVGMAALGGAVQGGFMGGIGTTWGYFANRDANRAAGSILADKDGRVSRENTEALIGEGLASQNEEIRNYAKTLEGKRNLSQAQAGQLYRMLVAEMQGEYETVKNREGEESEASAEVHDSDSTDSTDSLSALLGNGVSAAAVERIASDAELTAMLETRTGGKIEGTKAERRRKVKELVSGLTKTKDANADKAERPVMPDFSGRSLDKPISDAEFRAAYEARIAREIAAERARTEAGNTLGEMLSGEMTNDRADKIAKSQALATAFEQLTGTALTGTLAQKRRQIKSMQTYAAELLRSERAKARMDKLAKADTREKMRAALGGAGAAAYDAGYEAGVAEYRLRLGDKAAIKPAEAYNATFARYYRQGYRGGGFDLQANAVIAEREARSIYEAGRRDAKADTYLNATEQSAAAHGVSAEEGATARRLSQALDRKILFIDGGEDFHGCTSGGVIYLGAKSDRTVLQTVAHEYTHLLESKELYGRLRDFVFETLRGEGKTAEALRAAKRAEHEIYANLSDADTDREIVAAFVETRLLTDEQVMRAVVRREGKSFAHRLLDTLRGLIEKVKAALHIGNADAEQLKMLERGRDILAEVIRSEDVITLRDGEKNVTFSGEEPLAEQIQKALAGELPPRRSVYFGKTPNLLVKLGLKQKPLLASPSHMRENSLPKDLNHPSQHGITQAQFEKIPKYLAHPVMVMDSMTRSDSIVVVTDMLDADGLPIIIAINTAGDGFYQLERERVPANFISSVHGRSNFSNHTESDYIENNANNNTFLFIDKEKSQNLFRVLGVQFPVRLNDFGFDKIIRQSRNVVNSYSMQNSKNDADIGEFSVGGIKAKTAEVGRLADAERMKQGGADSETVRRETGWYRGYDGKWRFEIDDSKMRFINHREESRRTWKLDELIRHDALFAAYPELRDYTVLNFGISDDVEAAFYPGLNRITLDPRLSRTEKRAALIHEIQHAIQLIEGFSVGATTDYWRGSLKTAEEKQLELRLRDFAAPDIFFEADMRKLLEGTPAAERDAAQTALEKHYGEAPVREYVDLYNRLRDLRAEREQDAERAYRNTAGEIEAVDVANRLGLSERQRAETRPDIDREEVRFSQSAGWHHAEYDPETAGIKEQLEHSAETLNAMRTVTSVEVPQNFTSKSEAAKWAIETLKRTGYQVDRQGYGVIRFNAKDINRGANYADTSAEKAALAALPAVLKKGIEIGGHANHKAREKQTVTFAAPVELNGIRGNMAVVVNKRGDHYYAHRIVLPDGKAFVFSEKNNATREPSRGVTVSGSLAETTSVASKNSISNSAENVNTILKNDADIRFSVGDGQTDADAEVSDADKRFAPVESAIKLLKSGADLWRTLRETGASPREIALRMATSGESDAEIRRLTGLYRSENGVWVYDSAWVDAHIPDLAENRALRAGYKYGAIDEQLLGLAPEDVKASRRRLLDGAKLPSEADTARTKQAADALRRALRPTEAEFAETRRHAAAKEAARLITEEKVPSADAAIRTGALLADIADVLEKKKYNVKRHMQMTGEKNAEKAEEYCRKKILKLTGQVRDENGAWETDNAAMTKIIRAGSKQLKVQDFTNFLFDHAKELSESSYNSQYGMRKTYALNELGIKIQNPIVDIASCGEKPSELIANEREQEELKRYIENEYANAAHPTTAERADARDVATGIRTLGQISQDSRREVVLDLVYANLARRGLRDNGIETFYMVQKQRYAEELAQKIFKEPIAPGAKPVWQGTLTANTALRNNRMVFGEEVGRYLNETIFEKVVENEAERQRFMQREIDKIRELKLTKLESQAVQMLAEDTKESRLAFYELLKGKGKNLDVEKCRAAVTVFRACYNLYYDAINEFLVMHGYKPIGFQKNYMPRLQKEADVSALRERLNALGIETEEVTELPAEIAGRTETFKPGKKYNPFFEHRTSKENKNVQYDALGGFDSYITYLSEVLYHTDDIQKLRTLAGALRERYASGAVSKNIAELKEQLYSPDPDKSFADIEAKLTAAYDEVKLNNYFGTYATWLDDYTNNIAGKQTSFDRAFEYNIGRKTLNLGKRLNNTYSAAVIVGNLSSAFNQTVQLPFALTECGIRNMTRAFVDMLPKVDRLNKTAEFDKKSTFLAGKRGVDYASERAWNEKVTAAGGKFFEAVDMAVTRLILRAKYYQVTETNPNIGFDAAIREADRYISAMVGNRMKGAKPVLFNQKNVITRTLAAFQLEQLNFVEYVARDVPAKYRAYYKAHGTHATVRKIARELISALINVFVFNRLTELLYGQTPAAGDALGILVDSLGAGWNLTGNDFLLTLADDLCRTMTGERKLGTKERGDFSTQNALGAFGDEVGDDVPLVNNILAMLGVTNSKLPLPQIKAVTKAASGDFKGAAAQIPSDLATWVPFGSQVKKTARGVKLIADKGMYSSSGKLMFASDTNMWDSIRAVLFGPTANEEYRESFFGGRYLSAEETALWQQMRAAGGKPEESFDALQDVYNAGAAVREADPDAPSAEVKAAKVEKIDNLPLNGRLKALLLYGDVATTNEKAVMDALEVTLQVDHMKVYRFMSGFVLQEKVADKREYLKHDLILTDAEKATVYYHYFANDDAQDFIDELRRRGGKDADIYKVLAASYGREEEKITSADRATAITDSSLPASAKEEAMYELISDELHDKYTAVQDAGGSVDEFLAAYAATRGITSDKDRAGNTVALSKARKMKKAIDAAAPDAPKKVRRALYSAFGVSKSVWY